MAFLTQQHDRGGLVVTMSQSEMRKALTGNQTVQEFLFPCAGLHADLGVHMRPIMVGELTP